MAISFLALSVHLLLQQVAQPVLLPALLLPAQALPDPGHLIACMVQPMVGGLVELAATVALFKLGMRAISERSGEDMPRIAGLIILVLVLAGIIFAPATMTDIAHKLGATGITFAACPA